MTTIGWLVFALLLSAKALVILAVALLVTRLMRDRSAAERHLVWVIASAAVLALPALALAGPSWRIDVPSSWTSALERAVAEPEVSVAVSVVEPTVPAAVVSVASVRVAEVDVSRVERRVRMSRALGTQVLEPASGPAAAAEASAPDEPRVRHDNEDAHAIDEPDVSAAVSGAGIAIGPGLAAGSEATASDGDRTATASDGELTAASLVALFAILVAVTWLSGTLLVGARLLSGLVRVRGLTRTARPLTDAALHARANDISAELGVRRSIRMLEGDAAAMPITFGVLRPTLLLPSSARGWPRARQDAVLRHELEHVRRRDTLSQLIAELACALYWFNPLMWRAAHLMRVEREHACDDAVLAAGSRASDYATDLLDIARTLRYDHATEVAAIAMAKTSHLRVRVASLLDARRRRERATLRLMVPAWLGAAMLMIPLSSVVLEINRAAAVTDHALDDSTILQEPQEPAARSPRGPKPQQRPAGAPAPVAAPAPAAALRAPAPAAAPVPGSAVPAPMWLSSPPAPNAVPAPAGLAAPHAPPPAAAPWSAGQVPVAAPAPPARPGPLRTSPEPAPAAPEPPSMSGPRAIPGVAAPAPRFGAGPRDCLSGRNTSINSNSDDDRRTTRWSGNGCSGEVVIEGDVRFDESFTTITGISRGGRVRITTTEEGVTRLVTITPSSGGVTYDYAVNGNRQEFDAAGSDWLSSTLLFMFRRLGFMADERAAAIIRQGGASALLAETDLLAGDHVRSRYLAVLVGTGSLDAASLDRVLGIAARTISSDHYRTAIITAAAGRYTFTDGVRDAYIRAASGIESDHYMHRAFTVLLENGRLTPAQVASVLDETQRIDSDHYRAVLLTDLAGQYASSPGIRPAYLRAASGIESDHYRSTVLLELFELEELGSADLGQVIDAASGIDSDHYLQSVLARVAEHDDIDAGALLKLLDAAAHIGSDHYRSQLLVDVARRHRLQGEVRARFESVMNGIDSRTNRERVAEALRRSAA